jgi:hypothetical protein
LSEASKPQWKLGCNVCNSIVAFKVREINSLFFEFFCLLTIHSFVCSSSAFKGRRVETLRCARAERCTICASAVVVCTFYEEMEPAWLRGAVEEAKEASGAVRGDERDERDERGAARVTLEYRGCVVCDANLNALTVFHAPRTTHVKVRSRGRGGGRGGKRGAKDGGRGGGKGGGDRKRRGDHDDGRAAPMNELRLEL